MHRAAVFIIAIATLQLLVKAFQLFSLARRYFYHLSHWLEPLPALGSIVFTSITNTPCLCMPSWQWQIGVATVFVGWITLLLYFRRLPITGIYVVTFFDVLCNVLKMLGLLAGLLAGFGLSLHMLFFDAEHVEVSGCVCLGNCHMQVYAQLCRGCRILIRFAQCLQSCHTCNQNLGTMGCLSRMDWRQGTYVTSTRP